MVGAKVATQARALATWRGACRTLAGGAQPASGGAEAAVKERDRALQQARELESSKAALARQVAQLEASLREARAAAPTPAVGGRNAKTDALSQMLQEQQEVLGESYVFALRMKLQTMLGGTHVAAQTRALATWRGACVALSLAAAHPAAAPPVAKDAASGAKVQALSQMLQEQQQELADSYVFAAGSKLQAVMVGAKVATQARALATWRGACRTLAGGAQPASGGAEAAVKERDRALQQARELEASLAEARAEHERLLVTSRNAEQSHALKVQQLKNELESAASFAEEETPEGNDGASSAKVQALSQMLQEQQQEVAEGYLFAAGSKLRAVMVGATVTAQARALATWRGACLARVGDAQPAVPLANGAASGAKVQALSQMLQEQQQELADSYVFAAGSKLQAVMVGAKVATQARALATWRGACMLAAAPSTSETEASLRAQLRAVEAESKRHAMDSRSMGILVKDLEAQVRGQLP